MPDKIENAREILLEHGRAMLLQSGYGGLKVRDVTRQCGMASGTFYSYFQNKDELVFQLMDQGWSSLFEKIRAAMGSELPLHDKLAVTFREIDTRERILSRGIRGDARRAGPVRRLLSGMYDADGPDL
jgi:AcrR family transcriptional regulator